MKKIVSLLISVIVISNVYGQINESPLSAYEWKGKKTVLKPGYVVLKSGKKLEGNISLKGNNSNVTGVYFEGDGKEINFPLTAIKSYELNLVSNVTGNNSAGSYYSGPLTCDSNEGLFSWRDMGVQMGKQIHNTKPRNGYVIKRDGTTIEGELQIKKVDGHITEFVVKGDKGKFKLPAGQIGHYGLKMTMNELTKGDTKQYKDEAKNFHQGTIKLTSGESINGFVAFKKKTPINPNRPGEGDKYNGMYFAANETDFVKTFNDNEVSYISQTINGKEVVYSPYEGGFVSSDAMDNATYINKIKQFNNGALELVSGETISGELAMPNKRKVNYRNEKGIISAYAPEQVKKFVVSVNGESTTMVSTDGFFSEEFVNGNTFWVYENPKPTTVNEKRTQMARNALALSTSASAAAIMKQDEKKYDYESNVDSLLMNGTLEDLKKFQAGLWQIVGAGSSEEFQDKSNDDRMNKLEAAVQMSILGKEEQEKIQVYYKEIVVFNKQTQERIILYKNKDLMNEKLEGLLMGCYSFLELDKKEQKKYYDIDNIKTTFLMLDECY